MQQQQGFARDFDGLHHHVLGCVRDIADETEPVTGGNHLGAECGEPPMGDGASLEIADVVGRVMHKLQMPDAALMRFLQPFELAVEEVETFHVSDDRGLPALCAASRSAVQSARRTPWLATSSSIQARRSRWCL